MNKTTNICPKCQTLVPIEAPGGLCPKCALSAAQTIGQPPGRIDEIPGIEGLAPVFPDFEILEFIGRGGMGFVFKARQRRLDREVALKLLPAPLAADPHFSERFIREARALGKLNHPNIVTVYDFGVAGAYHYLTMEYVEGLNLRQAMRIGKFSPAEALAIVPKICDALQYAHEQGVLHRDIKPENILLDAAGRVKIADFGIAKILGEEAGAPNLTGAGAALGTPHYMAPEQFENPANVDHRADIYSLGVVFYEMLTGELPLGRFRAPSTSADLDERVDAIVLRALAKERELRQRDARELQNELENLGDTTRILGAASQKGPDGGRQKRRVLLAGAALAAAVLAIVWGSAQLKRAGEPDSSPAAAKPSAQDTERLAREDQAIQFTKLRYEQTRARHANGEASARDLALANRDLRVAEARQDKLAMTRASYDFILWEFEDQRQRDPLAHEALWKLERQLNQAQHAIEAIQAGTNAVKKALADLKYAERAWGTGRRWEGLRVQRDGATTNLLTPEDVKKLENQYLYAEMEYKRVKQREEPAK